MDDMMKAVVIHEYGDNGVVRIEDVERPRPQDGELLLRVRTAGVNPVDWKIRGGAGQRLGMTLPIRMGGELVGTVEALGLGVDGFEVGDTVYGMVHAGAFAQWAVAKASDMVLTPSNVGIVEAAALPLAGSTAWQALFDEAGLQTGQRLLITNSSGGVGSLAVQFAKARGAHVTAVASARNETFVRSLGADEFVDYTAGPFEDAVVRALRPGAESAEVIDASGKRLGTLEPGQCEGLFTGFVQGVPADYQFRFAHRSVTWEEEDPYRFGQIVSDLDAYLMAEGTHYRLYEKRGAHPREMDGVNGVAFAVWAPAARRVSVIGNFNIWDTR